MDVYEIKIKLYLLKDIKIEETQTYLAYFIDSVMVKDNMFLGIHETNQYKFYTFDSLYPLAKNGVYQKDNSYMFRIRTLDYQLAQYLYDTLAKNRTKEFQGLTAEVKIIKPKLIKKIYTLTPVILKTEQGYWKNSIKTEDFEKRLKTNLIKKYKDITGEEINEDFEKIITARNFTVTVKFQKRNKEWKITNNETLINALTGGYLEYQY